MVNPVIPPCTSAAPRPRRLARLATYAFAATALAAGMVATAAPSAHAKPEAGPAASAVRPAWAPASAKIVALNDFSQLPKVGSADSRKAAAATIYYSAVKNGSQSQCL